MKRLSTFLFSTLLCATALPALADSSADNQPPKHHKRHAPPAEAIEACKGLTAQDICQFNGRNNELVSGVCATPRRANGDETAVLACRSKHHTHDKSSTEDKSSN